MTPFEKGALDAAKLFKVADLMATPWGRKMVSNTIQSIVNPEGKPRVVRTLEPYYKEFILGEEDPYEDYRFTIL